MGHFWPTGLLGRDPLTEGLYETSLECLHQNWDELDMHEKRAGGSFRNRKYVNTSFYYGSHRILGRSWRVQKYRMWHQGWGNQRVKCNTSPTSDPTRASSYLCYLVRYQPFYQSILTSSVQNFQKFDLIKVKKFKLSVERWKPQATRVMTYDTPTWLLEIMSWYDE